MLLALCHRSVICQCYSLIKCELRSFNIGLLSFFLKMVKVLSFLSLPQTRADIKVEALRNVRGCIFTSVVRRANLDTVFASWVCISFSLEGRAQPRFMIDVWCFLCSRWLGNKTPTLLQVPSGFDCAPNDIPATGATEAGPSQRT